MLEQRTSLHDSQPSPAHTAFIVAYATLAHHSLHIVNKYEKVAYLQHLAIQLHNSTALSIVHRTQLAKGSARRLAISTIVVRRNWLVWLLLWLSLLLRSKQQQADQLF